MLKGSRAEADEAYGLHVHCILQGISTSWQREDPGTHPTLASLEIICAGEGILPHILQIHKAELVEHPGACYNFDPF